MLKRRSIRKYKPEQIAESELNTILLAGTYAPSAGGRQSPVIVVCRNTEINNALGKINKAAFHGRMSTENVFISKVQPSIADDATIVSAFYGAPTVLTLFAPENFLYSSADCYVAAQNIAIAAHSLGIGSCIVARAEDTFSSELGQKLQKDWVLMKVIKPKYISLWGILTGQFRRQNSEKKTALKLWNDYGTGKTA
jgi:nitroreductase